jgi:hypothetical protein
MSLERKYSIYRKIAVFVAINVLAQIFAPTAAWALTGGPASPEFSSFEPVATTNMVSEFSGDLTYNLPVINIPGVNGGGYAMSLSYHSGTTPEEESSWVGYGWTLNPGAINRGKKGFADDLDNAPVKYWNKTPANQTVAIGGSIGNLELFSFNAPVSANSSIRYNNYKGFGYTIGAGISLAKGVVSLGYSVSDGTGSFSLSLNPAAAMKGNKDKGEKGDRRTSDADLKNNKDKKVAAIKKMKETGRKSLNKAEKESAGVSSRGALSGLGSGYGIHNFASASRPTQIVDYEGISTTVSLNLLLAPSPLQAGITLGAFGSYTRQKNTEESDLNTFGYMYSANAGGGDMMDYFVEKGSTYTKQDKFLGIPFSNADNYSLTGEGLGGGFKLHNKKSGTFHPNSLISVTNIFNVTPEVEVGFNYGGGGDIGVGHQELKVGGWDIPTLNGFSPSTADEDIFFRFANDMGGELSYDGGNTDAEKANVVYTSWTPGAKSAEAQTNHISKNIKYNKRALRSSYIGYNTNDDMALQETNGIGVANYKAYAKNTNAHLSNGSINRSGGTQIGEFSIVNEDGTRYNYGIPVLSQEEKNLQVDLNGLSAANIENRFLAYRDITGSSETKVGEERPTPYATSYLLTGITSPDYIDRSNNGPTDDDFGGYTKFSYHKAYGQGVDDVNPGGGDDWYKWRMPYAGLSYSRNELSNPNDDLGSVAEGYKEMYYLETVETKTHYAVFYTSKRRDGLDAEHDEATASTTAAAQGNFSLNKLDKIELFAKNPSGGADKLIKTVHFEYDYSLCQGVLNNDGQTDSNNPINQGGKLTLKKVWFEYNGVVEAKISPYQFEYKYPTTAQVNYPARYDSFENYGNYSAVEQNPNYSSFNIDAWGNYQYDGAPRFDDMKPWLDQSGTNSASFDPAAWQLKVIKLPSGGEIHVQYEQDDYCYVQDKQAHALVKLKSGGSDSEFIVDTEDLQMGGLSLVDKEKLASIITKEYIIGGKKMYFKILYKLIGNAVPHLTDCNAEYVTGYADVHEVDVVNGELVVTLKDQGYSLPKDVCEDYVTTQRAGNLSFVGSNCDPSGGATIGGGSATSKVLGFLGQAATWFASLAPGTTCLEINSEYSYLKIPLLDAKKGGGVRVKRLLMFDKGIDTGKPVLYGSEYIYKTFDDKRKEYRSSGVATNEPGSIREENALIGFMDRFSQSFWDKVVSGRDKKNSEGPIGESILPGASVGYSKIITKSIHSGKTNPGFVVKEFYTAKDYPVKMEMTEMERDNKDYLPLITGLVNKTTNNLWVAQGYAFEINSMHGQLKSSSTYAGDYSDILNPNTSTLVSQEVMTYFQPGEELPILNLSDLSHANYMPLGKEMEMVFESKFVKDINTDGNIEMDADVGVFGIAILPFLSAFPTMTFTETELYTHTTTKVISYPAVVKSTKSYADGIYHITENVAFNPETGKPIKVRTTDGFDNLNLLASNNHDGDYTKYTFPASMEYENVSQKAKNERKIVIGTGTTSTDVTIEKIVENGKAYLSFSATPPTSVCAAMANFVGGDLIKIPSGVYHSGDIAGSRIEIQPTNYSSLGIASSGAIDVEIVRSGRTNQLNLAVGSLTTYGNSNTIITPVPQSILGPRQVFADLLTDALTGVIDTIFPWDIPVGVDFVNPDGSCGPLDSSCYILVEGNQVNIYGPGVPFGQDTVIVGTPTNPHPMVDTLNNYLTTYWNYSLDTSNSVHQCGSTTSTLNTYQKSNLNTDVALMRSNQLTTLAQIFSDVNGGIHSIDEYLMDEGIGLGYTRMSSVLNTSLIPISMLNKNVLLKETLTGKKMGAELGCSSAHNLPELCVGCMDSSKDPYCISNIELLDIGMFTETTDGYLAFKYGDFSPCETQVRFYRLENGTAFPELKCSSTIIFSGGYGHFDIDPKTAALVYFAEDNDCYAQDVPCLRFCSEHYPSTAITNVVASEANTLNDHWNYKLNDYAANGLLTDNDYETGKRGKWRTKCNYAFKTDVDRLSSTPISYDKNYNSGVYELELFNWENLNANGQKWLELNTVKKYSPNGNALEEENILGIKSAAKFGYHKTLPYLIAQNAEYNSIMFESFENNYAGYVEDGIQLTASDGMIDNNESHSGASSFKLQFPANDGVEMTEMVVNSQILAKGLLFKTWIKTDFDDRTILDNFLKAELKDVNTGLSISKSFKKVAQVGDWYLYEAKILPTDFVGMNIDDVLKTFVKYEFTPHGSENVWIDDIRIQPMDAQATAYVYDVVTHRLVTTFDDQHFGLFYQYNAEGKLVRKLIETERGMKTVQETQYNTPKITR